MTVGYWNYFAVGLVVLSALFVVGLVGLLVGSAIKKLDTDFLPVLGAATVFTAVVPPLIGWVLYALGVFE